MTFGGTVGHTQVAQRVSHENDVVTMNQLLKVVGLVQRVLVLVEDVNQSAMKTFQQTLQTRQLGTPCSAII